MLQGPRVGVLAGLHKIVQVEVACDERGGLAVRLVQQRLVPLKVAHHLLKARALVEAVRPERLHLLLRNFARRPFHAPALGPRVAQLGYLAVHGLRQPVGQLGAAQVDLVVRHHPDELKNLLPAGDEARAQRVVHAEGLGGRGGRRSRVVRGIRELLAQLQVVQNEPVAVVGYAQAVRGLAIGGSGKVGADPGGQPCASVRALGQQRPVQRARRQPSIL